MQAGCYTLDLYCDHESDNHEWDEFPHKFWDELGSKARKKARAKGWIFHKDGTHSCPKCSRRKS